MITEWRTHRIGLERKDGDRVFRIRTDGEARELEWNERLVTVYKR